MKGNGIEKKNDLGIVGRLEGSGRFGDDSAAAEAAPLEAEAAALVADVGGEADVEPVARRRDLGRQVGAAERAQRGVARLRHHHGVAVARRRRSFQVEVRKSDAQSSNQNQKRKALQFRRKRLFVVSTTRSEPFKLD